jgi:hypothetical protein
VVAQARTEPQAGQQEWLVCFHSQWQARTRQCNDLPCKEPKQSKHSIPRRRHGGSLCFSKRKWALIYIPSNRREQVMLYDVRRPLSLRIPQDPSGHTPQSTIHQMKDTKCPTQWSCLWAFFHVSRMQILHCSPWRGKRFLFLVLGPPPPVELHPKDACYTETAIMLVQRLIGSSIFSHGFPWRKLCEKVIRRSEHEEWKYRVLVVYVYCLIFDKTA